MPKKEKGSNTIPTNLRLLAVLEIIAASGIPVTPTEVNKQLGLPKPTIHRLFSTLEGEGFIQRDLDGQRYVPGLKMHSIATGTLSSLQLRTSRIAIMTRLADTIGETCNISLPDKDAMIYLERVETKWPLRIQLQVGSRVPFYCTASGKMFLSTLDNRQLKSYATAASLAPNTTKTITDPHALIAAIKQVRTQGYATDEGEFLEGMTAVAVPILEQHGRLVATLAIHGPQQRLPLERALSYIERLKEAAQQLSDLL